jgi:hypothetical protein
LCGARCAVWHLAITQPGSPRHAQGPDAALAKLAEALHRFYPSAVPLPLVWGYGRPLWDPCAREYGRRPLKVVVLGPAGSGKSTQCELLAHRCVFGRKGCVAAGLSSSSLTMQQSIVNGPCGAPHPHHRFGLRIINAGDVLHSEVRRRTPLGLEAERFVHGSGTVPDRCARDWSECVVAVAYAASSLQLDGFASQLWLDAAWSLQLEGSPMKGHRRRDGALGWLSWMPGSVPKNTL